MTCTEFILAKSPEPTTIEELEKLPSYNDCIMILNNQPGYVGLTSGMVQADPTLIVWLVGELLTFNGYQSILFF